MDWFDPGLIAAGLVVGFVVGLTGMGGGALMTPVLILLFKVDALTAVSSDLVVSLFMKPGGALVHLRRKTVNLKLVGWLCVGSIPAAFAGSWLLTVLPDADGINATVRILTGCALLLGAAGLALRTIVIARRARVAGLVQVDVTAIAVRPVSTIILGALGGLIVGMTSIGAGSVIIVALLTLYPGLRTASLVGTDLVQAVPLVASASLGHLLFGDIDFSLAVSLLIGAIPAAWAGAQLSSRAPDGIIRPALFILLLCSGAKLVGVSTEIVVAMGGAALAVFLVLFVVQLVRRRMRSAEGSESANSEVQQ